MNRAGATGVLSRIVGVVIGAVALVFALLFSVALFVALAVVGLGAFGYLWWKTRAVRRAMREQQQSQGGRIIESTEIYEVRDDVRLEDRSNSGRGRGADGRV